MNTVCDAIGKPQFDANALKLYFVVLADYDIDSVQKSLFKALSDEESKYGITPALIVKHLGVRQERKLNWQDVIEAARKPTTPMGVLARIHIKSYNLNNYENIAIKHRADTFMDGLDDMKARALDGDYTEHEIVTMISYGVKVASPFMIGMSATANQDALRAKYNKAIQSPLHLENVARIESRERQGIRDGNSQKKQTIRISDIVNKISADIPPERPEMTSELAKSITGIS